jgi:hypothetical protein
MKEKIIIVGLRSIDPIPLVFGADCSPGYFCEVLSTHRNGFQLPGFDCWFAFLTNPFSAIRLNDAREATPYLTALCDHDPGRWRPLILLTIFE